MCCKNAQAPISMTEFIDTIYTSCFESLALVLTKMAWRESRDTIPLKDNGRYKKVDIISFTEKCYICTSILTKKKSVPIYINTRANL